MAADYSSGVLGFPPPPPPGPTDLPPGQGAYAVPHPFGFASLYNQGYELYRWSFDEALRHNVTNALAMRRDPVIMAALEARQRPTALLEWHVDPEDETDPAESEAAAAVEKLVKRVRDYSWFRFNLLESIWYGRQGAQLRYSWEYPRGEKRLVPGEWLPVNGDKIRFHWDGRAGITVHAQAPVEKEVSDFTFVHWLTPSERQQFVLARYKPEDADWREGEFAGQLQGVGARSRLYWWWWLKQQFLGLLANYIQRFANGLTVITFDAHNPQAQEWAKSAAHQAWSQAAFTIPQWDSTKPNVNSVNRLEVGTASPALLENLITEYFDAKIKEYILGQNLTSESDATGLGSGLAAAHMDTLSQILKFDAECLDGCIQHDLVDVIYRWGFRGVRPGIYSSAVDSPDAEEFLANAEAAYEMGMDLDEDQMREVLKLAKPKPGKPILSQLQAMQAAAVGQPGPDGMPVAGAGGPPGMQPQPGQGQPGQPPQDPNAVQAPEQPLAFSRRDEGRLKRYFGRKLTPNQRRRIRERIMRKTKGRLTKPEGWRGDLWAYLVAAADL